jgi:hypothetical protein
MATTTQRRTTQHSPPAMGGANKGTVVATTTRTTKQGWNEDRNDGRRAGRGQQALGPPQRANDTMSQSIALNHRWGFLCPSPMVAII